MKEYNILFCDMDGTLIETISGNEIPEEIWDMKFKFDVLDAIKNMKPDYVFVVSNQGGVEKGYFSSSSIESKIDYVCTVLGDYCKIPHHKIGYRFCTSNNPDNEERKPNVGMLDYFYELYVKRLYDNKNCCLMIGDASGLPGQFSDSDKKTAENFGIDYLDVDEFVEIYNR